MKKLKKVLSMVLVLCMVVGSMSVSVFADETETVIPTEETTVEEPAEEILPDEDLDTTEPSETQTTEDEVEVEEEVVAEEDALTDEAALAADDIQNLAAGTQPTAPADGTVSGSPFVYGTAGSNSFRIPAMVTLSDGTLVAAADARWNTTYDGGCGDTIVARSYDNGSNWNYTFANYLGDNGNSYNGSSSTCFIDPALAVTSNDTIYMLVDLYPYGIALNGSGNTAPSKASGFNADGTLKLSTDGSNYNYYLKDGKIYNSSNTAVSGVSVDAYYNIYNSSNEYVSNLFFADSPYKVVRTGYLYLTSSTDGGASWSAPTLLNLKTTSEQVCLVGPGRGTVLSDGTIIFPVYSYNGSSDSQRTGFIYSTDGVNWSRTDSNISWSSEAAVVEVNSSTLRVFYRNGNSKICYVDVTKSGNSYSWGSVVTTSVSCNSNTQLSAIKVTESGTDYILVSNPGNASSSSSASARTNGQIVTFKAEDMSVVKTTSVASVHSSNSFMYSCMSQLNSGDIAILYEDQESGWGTGNYYQMSFKTFALSELGIETAPVGSDTITDEATNVTVKTADGSYLTAISSTAATVASIDNDYAAYDVTLNGGAFTGKATVTIPLNDKLKSANTLAGFVVENGAATQIAGTKSEDGNYYSFETPHFSVVGVMSLDEPEYSETVTLTVGETSSTYTVSSNTNYGSVNATTDDGIASYVQSGTAATAGTTYTQVSATCNNIISSNKNSWTATNYYYTPDGTNYYPVYAKRSSSWKIIYTEYTYTFGYSTTNKSSNVTQIGNTQTTTDNSSSADITVYTKSGSGTATSASTTIQFTGVTSGTTYVTSGTTTYKVVVSAKTSTASVSTNVDSTETLNPTIPTGGSVSYEVTSGSDNVSVTADGTVKGLNAGSATIVATVKASNGKAVEVITYDVSVAEKSYEQDVTIAIAEDKTISVDLERGQYVEWASTDANTAAVVGTSADTAVLLGSKSGTAVVTGTVKDANGNVVATYKWNVKVTDSNTKSKYIYVNVSKIEHTTVYYSVNGGELIKVNGTGVILDEAVTGHYQLAFYAAPDEGYALTYMASTNSAGEYYCLSDGEYDGVNGSAWPFADGYDWETKGISTTGGDSTVYNTKNGFRWGLAEGNISIAQLRNVYARAIAQGCDGTLVFTKNNAGTTSDDSSNGNNLHSDLTFVSQPLPTMTKTIKSVGGNAYQAGTTKVKLGDEIVYTVTVTRPATNASYGTITYSNEELKDPMTDGDTNLMPSGTMGTSTTSDKIYSYETKITLNLDNYDDIVQNGTITNTADFAFSYKSQYSNGKLSSSANASADQIVIDAPSYVVDFGLPMSFELDKNIFGTSNATQINVSATYGTVAITDGSTGKYKVTYTPNKVLQGIDTIKFTVGQTNYIVMIYPATTVYYEEGFATLTGTWTGSTGSASQNTAVIGSDSNNYGYDAAYSSSTGSSNGTSADSTKSGDTASFTFTGTGIDINATCSKSSGNVSVKITDAAGATQFMAMVNTASINGETELTTYPSGNLYNVPIASVTGLTHGTYTVTITKLFAKGVSIDGYRVYNTLKDSSIFVTDDEDNPNFIEARDLNFGTIDLSGMESRYASNVTKQVYQLIKENDGVNAVITSAAGANVAASKDLVDNGPKNEIYLYPGMSLTLSAQTARMVQIGLRGLQSGLTCKVGSTSTAVSTTDMFYTAKTKGNTGTVTITNPSSNSGILAVTKIKVCDDPGVLAPITEENINDTLLTVGYEADPSTDLTITQQPTSVTAKLKDKVSFSVVAENAASYQWYYTKNGKSWYKSTAAGATTDTLSITVSSTNEANQYRCKVTGIDGTVEYTDTVNVNVLRAAKITSQPVSVSAQIGDKVSFSVTAENAVSYQWYYSKDGGNKWYKTSVSGAATESISLKVSSSNINNIYRCKITGQDGKAVYSASASLKG